MDGRRFLTSSGPWLGVTALAAWTRWSSPWWLLACSFVTVPMLFRGRLASRWLAAAAAALIVGMVSGWVALGHLRYVAQDWPGSWATQEAALATALGDRFVALIDAGDGAVAQVAARAAEGGQESDLQDIWTFLEEVRLDGGLDAVAVFDSRGDILAWAGNHQGLVPLEARSGLDRYVYGEHPLYAYLYFTARIPGAGGTAMAAALLKSDLPPAIQAERSDFVARFLAETGGVINVSRSDRAAGPVIRDLTWDGRSLFSISFEQPTQGEVIEAIRLGWGRVVASLVLLAWLVLAVGGRGAEAHATMAGASLLLLMALLPFGELLGVPWLFSPGQFLLPGPWGGTLGRVLVIALSSALIVGVAPIRPVGKTGALFGGIVAGVGFATVTLWVAAAPTLSYLGGDERYWLAYQGTLALLLALVAVVALWLGRGARSQGSPALTLTGLTGAVTLGLLVHLWFRSTPPPPHWLVALWAVPVVVTALGLGSRPDWRGSFATWVAAIVVGISASLPFAWGDRIAARMEVARGELETLGSQVDPYLQFLLEGLPEKADSLHRAGATGVELLYGVWRTSGLAQEGIPVWLDIWTSGGMPGEVLRIGVSGPRPPVADDYLEEARLGAVDAVLRLDREDTHYLALAPLSDGSVITAAVPPRRGLAAALPIGTAFGGGSEFEEPVTLIPLGRDDPLPGDTSPRWVRTADGWQAEHMITYPEGLYHAHYTVGLPGTAVLFARGALVVILDVFLLLGVWAVGRWVILGHVIRPAESWLGLASFQARVTVALFGFFLVPALAFATVASGTLDGAALRTAEALAGRAVTDAAADFLAVQGEIDLLSGRTGADLLLYEDGVLTESSTPALLELGVHEAWVPTDVHQALSSGEAVLTHARQGRWGVEYVVAYRRLQGGRVLSSAAPLAAGATALGQRDLVQLLTFAIVAGVALSLGLALLVGRALSRPIHTLQVASERVGEGNLGVCLPEDRTDEFGSVFSAFNRMVHRLRGARSALVRTTRRTQAIVEEAATGVIALDAGGVVTLVNPPAEALLDAPVKPGETLPASAGLANELSDWVERFYQDGFEGADTEFQSGERRVRVRARRITREGPSGGTVLSLEDVTDELRSERIVAWGEMARQVAHEVKNPLTPIKLSVQHIRRAWQDERSDFSDILGRNVDAILGEIDRLAAIARSFSRFGSPKATGEIALERVDIGDTVAEILALYGSGEEGMAFEVDIPADLAAVRSREPELKEVVINLLENARAAIGEGGRVRIDARPERDGVRLRVIDDGSGIEPELLPRIFEPRFSTSSTGTGLGLAIVQRLVHSWGGDVSVESVPGEGTTMSLRLVPWGAVETVRMEPRGGGGEGNSRH